MRTAAAGNEFREVMDIRQASDYLGISPDTLYKYASTGFIPAFKLGNRWRFKRSRLDGWMDEQSTQGASPEGPPVDTDETELSHRKRPQAVRPRHKTAAGDD